MTPEEAQHARHAEPDYSKPGIIKPTVGRIVHFYQRHPSVGIAERVIGPLAAIVARVWSNTMVNLTVFMPDGAIAIRTSVRLVHDIKTESLQDTGEWCEWMPFQKGQAAKTEAAEAKPIRIMNPTGEMPEVSGDKTYLVPDTFDFGSAIRLLKGDHRVARKGWNGKGMFIYLNKGSFDGSMLGFPAGENPIFGHPSSIDGIGLDLFESGDTGTVTRLPNVNMRSAGGATVTGWLASQTDMLATDWMVMSIASRPDTLKSARPCEGPNCNYSPSEGRPHSQECFDEAALGQGWADFGLALKALEDGKRVKRTGWNGKGLWLELQKPDANSKMTLPYLFLNYPVDAINTPKGHRVPWAPSQTDLLVKDWSLTS